MLNRDGMHVKGSDGKQVWTPVILFASRELRDRWSDAVLAALRFSHPNALAPVEMPA
jgi:hypothetical protein